MNRLIITLGSIAGAILVFMLALSLIFMNGDLRAEAMQYGEIVGYATMIISLSLIYVGIRKFRDDHLDGQISFLEGFKIGILITLVASIIYVVGWMILSDWLAPDFLERYSEFTLNQMRHNGSSTQEIAEAKAMTDKYIELYKNPLLKAGMTFMEVFPVGLIITLISSLILKRK
ncbi:MAG: DUF4199 domain-containing protein [Saprospiraceae bacterium]|nr:DUF4199 domain-containing protein [Saprospiraceae bacterium]